MRAKSFLKLTHPISAGRFLVLGAFLFTLKYALDATFAMLMLGEVWLPWDYLNLRWRTLSPGDERHLKFLLYLLAFSVPFICLGLGLTLRRIRTIGWSPWLLLLFFVPYLNLLFFLALSLARPSRVNPTSRNESLPLNPDRGIIWTMLITAFISLVLIGFSATLLNSYGWGLFVGIPFLIGFIPGLTYRAGANVSFWSTARVSSLSLLSLSMLLLLLGGEGLICLIMAAPLAVFIGLIGTAFGWFIRRTAFYKGRTGQFNCCAVLLVPLICGAEKFALSADRLIAVTTSVEIKAAPETVWRHVIAFPDLSPPDEFIFRAGVAFPIRAEINGRGPGAERLCVFSTGPFVEPILIWDEPRLLRFAVTSNPNPMAELSPYEIHPPHLEGFLVSRAGQFKLIPSSTGTTLLEGTTWYTHGLWPHRYWRLWSDYIIHTIHLRVLRHIKNISESNQ